MSRRMRECAVVASFYALASGCSEDITSPDYNPVLPTEWAAAVTNPLFPLVPGTRWEYEGQTDEGTETVVVEVLNMTRTIKGVTATIVRDRVFVDGELVEDTDDWFAQDAAGNVWYLGEASKDIEDGRVVSTEGSWEWGQNGALPGIIMWADPAAHVGEAYRQEFARGAAEDWGKVVALNQSVQVAAGSFTGCIKTEDWNGLEPDERENKWYCPNVGVVKETAEDEQVQLLRVTRP